MASGYEAALQNKKQPAIFDTAGVPTVSRQTHCNILNDIAKT